jgi:hypothetical protein
VTKTFQGKDEAQCWSWEDDYGNVCLLVVARRGLGWVWFAVSKYLALRQAGEVISVGQAGEFGVKSEQCSGVQPCRWVGYCSIVRCVRL